MAKDKVEKFGDDEIRNLGNLESKAGDEGGPEQTGTVGQRDAEGEVSLKDVYVNPALRGDVSVFDDEQGKEVTLSPGIKYSLDPKTAEKKYHDTPLFVDADE